MCVCLRVGWRGFRSRRYRSPYIVSCMRGRSVILGLDTSRFVFFALACTACVCVGYRRACTHSCTHTHMHARHTNTCTRACTWILCRNAYCVHQCVRSFFTICYFLIYKNTVCTCVYIEKQDVHLCIHVYAHAYGHSREYAHVHRFANRLSTYARACAQCRPVSAMYMQCTIVYIPCTHRVHTMYIQCTYSVQTVYMCQLCTYSGH
jgi:hypothetical protein